MARAAVLTFLGLFLLSLLIWFGHLLGWWLTADSANQAGEVMVTLVALLLLAGCIAVLVGFLWPLIAPQVAPEAYARKVRTRDQKRARWWIDDIGTNDKGECEMAIVLSTPGGPRRGRRVVGIYTPGDNLQWAELRGQADAMAKELNQRIETGS